MTPPGPHGGRAFVVMGIEETLGKSVLAKFPWWTVNLFTLFLSGADVSPDPGEEESVCGSEYAFEERYPERQASDFSV